MRANSLPGRVNFNLPQSLVRNKNYLQDEPTSTYDSNIITRVFPVIIAWALIFTDGPLLLGMLNAQNSPLNETVIDILYYITLCRLLQLATSYFLDDFLAGRYFQDEQGKGDQFFANFIACHLASVCAFVVAGYHFLLAAGYTNNIGVLKIGIQSNGLQITLLVLLAVFELLKVLSVLLTIFGALQGQGYLTFVRFQFTAEWMCRLVLIFTAIFVYSAHLRDQNDVLIKYLSP